MKKLILLTLMLVCLAGQAWAQSAVQVDFLLAGLHDSNGNPLSGYYVWTYYAGTTTKAPAWIDPDMVTKAADPIVLDTYGSAQVYASGWYKFVVTSDSAGLNAVFTWDNLNFTLGSTCGLQLIQQMGTLTYINGTQFSIPGDFSAVFLPGIRVEALVTAGNIYGTVASATYNPGTGKMTVTCVWDSLPLDNGLSAIYNSIISPSNNGLPILPVKATTGNYTINPTDIGEPLTHSAASGGTFTLPAASTIPSGGWFDIENMGTGTLTISGTVDGVSNPVLLQYGHIRVYSNGSAWLGSAPALVNQANTFTGTNAFTGTVTLNGYNAIAGPSVTCYTSGSGTYTVPTGAVMLHVKMTAGGGGGCSGDDNGTYYLGYDGVDTLFGSASVAHGYKSTGIAAAAGGSTFTPTGMTSFVTINGGRGGFTTGALFIGSPGGNSIYGGAGNVCTGAGTAATGWGSGGAGGSTTNASHPGGGGGGSGATLEGWYTGTLADTYAYSVGSGGSGGSSGGAGYAGGAGKGGIIIIEAYF